MPLFSFVLLQFEWNRLICQFPEKYGKDKNSIIGIGNVIPDTRYEQ